MIVGQILLSGVCFQGFGTYQDQRAEVEIVAQAALLVVYERMGLPCPVLYGVVVGIKQVGTGVVGHTQQSVEGMESQFQRRGFVIEQAVFGLAEASHVQDSLCTENPVGM